MNHFLVITSDHHHASSVWDSKYWTSPFDHHYWYHCSPRKGSFFPVFLTAVCILLPSFCRFFFGGVVVCVKKGRLALSALQFLPSCLRSLCFLKGSMKLCKAFPLRSSPISLLQTNPLTRLMRVASETQQLPSLTPDKLIMRGADFLEHWSSIVWGEPCCRRIPSWRKCQRLLANIARVIFHMRERESGRLQKPTNTAKLGGGEY